jgi:hypothetical protein
MGLQAQIKQSNLGPFAQYKINSLFTENDVGKMTKPERGLPAKRLSVTI